MTITEWLCGATAKLASVNIDSARLDSLILLEDALHQERAYILAHPNTYLAGQTHEVLEQQLERRAQHEPLAYIRGFCEFYGRKFMVNQSVMVPRPESESFMELIKPLINQKPQNLLDIGTGSGILAITAKLEFPSLTVTATDISGKALRVAKLNVKKLGARIKIIKTDLLDSGVMDKYDIILANLPYVPIGYVVSPATKHEPSQALFGGSDGLDIIKRLAPPAYQSLKSGGYILLESMPNQHPCVKKFYEDAGFDLTATNSLVQCFNKL
jgi:release factor glutamine methyltransferase